MKKTVDALHKSVEDKIIELGSEAKDGETDYDAKIEALRNELENLKHFYDQPSVATGQLGIGDVEYVFDPTLPKAMNCMNCGRTFFYKSDPFSVHALAAGTPVVKCPYCGKAPPLPQH